MAQSEYAFVGQDGSAVCQTADGEYITIDMNQGNHREAELSQIRFFSDVECQNQVTPTAGTIQVVGSPDGFVWFTIENGSFNAADAYNPDRVRPYAQGDMLKAKLILSGVTGAAYFKASMWRD